MNGKNDAGRGARRQQSWAGVAAVLAVATALAGCGSGNSAATTATTTGTASGGTAPPASTAGSGCGTSASPGSTTLHLRFAGRSRVVIVHVPTGYTGSTKVALVLNMHGSGSDASEQELFSGMDATSDEDGFIVAYPQGLIAAGGGFDWNIPGVPLFGGSYPPPGAADDVGYLTDLVPAMAARYCIDTSRVYATGVSGGGRMASQLACDSSSVFAAVAPVAGLRLPSPCPATRSVPVIAFHGTADPIDPYNGHGQAYWTYSVPVAAQRWSATDGCRPTPQTTSAAGYTLTTYSGCSGGAVVELYLLTGEGHEWPGGPTLPRTITSVLGPQSMAVNANSTMWAFFLAHPLR
jgi:polyhydroxybutyrate depolymerase